MSTTHLVYLFRAAFLAVVVGGVLTGTDLGYLVAGLSAFVVVGLDESHPAGEEETA